MEDRQALIVYLPKKSRAKIQKQADEEGTSASAVARRELVKVFPPK